MVARWTWMVVAGTATQKHFGKYFVDNLKVTSETESACRLRIAQFKYNKHKHVLTHRHPSVKMR